MAEKQIGQPIKYAYFSTPLHNIEEGWNEMYNAAAMAGLNVVNIFSESYAANSMNYKNKKVLVFNMGINSYDIT
jgi:molecular chaperone DnaK (HSP70)